MNTGPESLVSPEGWFAEELASPPAERRHVASLVERSRGGCHEAYRELVESHRDRIFRFCLGWTGNPEDAEELCQDTFVRAYSAMPRYEGEERFRAWLYRIARNRCHDHHRSRSRRNSSRNRSLALQEKNNLASPSLRPDESAVDFEELAALRSAIAELPERLREVVVLCCIEGMSQESCANVLGCSRRAVEGRLYRARMELAEKCGRHGG